MQWHGTTKNRVSCKIWFINTLSNMVIHMQYTYDGMKIIIYSDQIRFVFLIYSVTYSQEIGIHYGGHGKFSMTFDCDASVHSSLFDIYTEALGKNRSRSVANFGNRNMKWDKSPASTEHKGQRFFSGFFFSPLKSIRYLCLFSAL